MPQPLLIFDLDGTLVDSERLSIQALFELIPSIGDSFEELMHRYRGVKLNMIFSNIEDRYDVALPVNFEDTFRAHCAMLFERDLKSFPGTVDMLKSVSNSRCIASSGPLKKINNSLRITGLAPFFGVNLFSSYEIQSWKPKPDLFLHAASEMGFEPANCIVIEDSEVGVEAAKAAGMVVFHFAGTPAKSVGPAYQFFPSMTALTRLIQAHQEDHL